MGTTDVFFPFLQRRGPVDKFLGNPPSWIHDFPGASLFPPSNLSFGLRFH